MSVSSTVATHSAASGTLPLPFHPFAPSPRHPLSRSRRGIILPIALMIIALLAVLAARVVFHTNADMAAVQASEASLQARWAAMAGIQKALSVLQGGSATDQSTDGPTGMDVWYNNPQAFQAIIVQSPNGNINGLDSGTPSAKPSSANPAIWRFSVVGNDPLAQPGIASIRYGLTDEASKLNINAASQDQIAKLIRVVSHDNSVDPDDLAKAIDYYRRSKKADQSEDTYYQSLDPPYSPKHAPFTSVEELLMVRGMTGRLLYGEDWNRNGMLDSAENDGNASFPPDNGDGTLDCGLYPFLTVWSSDPGLGDQNKQKININAKDLTALRTSGLTQAQLTDIGLRTQNKSIGSLLELTQPSSDGRPPVFTKEDLPYLMGNFTTAPPKAATGLVNINTAPSEVLQAIGFTEDEAHQIIVVRAGLSSQDRGSTAWLVQQGVIDSTRLGDIMSSITARPYQYHVESVGFADHVGTFCRLEAIIKMQSPLPIPQVVYWRDLSSLGVGWPVRGQEGTTVVVNSHG